MAPEQLVVGAPGRGGERRAGGEGAQVTWKVMLEARAARNPPQEKVGSCASQVFVGCRGKRAVGPRSVGGMMPQLSPRSRLAQREAMRPEGSRTEKEASITPDTMGTSVRRTSPDGWVPRKSLRGGHAALSYALARSLPCGAIHKLAACPPSPGAGRTATHHDMRTEKNGSEACREKRARGVRRTS